MSNTHIAGTDIVALTEAMEARGYLPEPPESRSCQSLADGFGIDLNEPESLAFAFHAWGMKQTGKNSDPDMGRFLLVVFDLKNDRLLCEELKEIKGCLDEDSRPIEVCGVTHWQASRQIIPMDVFLRDIDAIVGKKLPEPAMPLIMGNTKALLKPASKEITTPKPTWNILQRLASVLPWLRPRPSPLEHV